MEPPKDPPETLSESYRPCQHLRAVEDHAEELRRSEGGAEKLQMSTRKHFFFGEIALILTKLGEDGDVTVVSGDLNQHQFRRDMKNGEAKYEGDSRGEICLTHP